MNQLPYVVSQDIDILLAQWAKKHGFQIPEAEFFIHLRNDFAQIMNRLFPNFVYLTAADLQKKIHQMVNTNEEGTGIISLDRVYYPSALNVSVTRTVDQEFRNLGISQRAGNPTLEEQLQKIVKTGIKKAVLVDDVVFSGGLIKQISHRLREMDVCVSMVYTAVGVGDGVKSLEADDLPVRCVHYYPKVVDQVCERDFFLGVPSCGRTLVDTNGLIWGVPYIKPFGDPNWASIPPEAQTEYSRFCISQSLKLWEAIEEASEKKVLCRDLSRPMVGFPINGERFVNLLKKHL